MCVYKGSLATILALLLALPILAQNPGTNALIWQDRGDAALLDLVSGSGGKDHEPGVNFKLRIPIDDARWIGNRLGQFSDEQIRDCFRAAGFSNADVEIYTRTVRQRITELEKL